MTGDRISIREAVPEDAAAISSLLRDAFAQYRPLYTPGGFAATALASGQILERMREGPVWVALRDGVIIGTASGVPRGEALYVRGMAVHPAARGRGAGRHLLRHVESYASERGYRRLTLSTAPFLDRAIRLYERFGFRRGGESPRDLFGTPLFTMGKELVNKRENCDAR